MKVNQETIITPMDDPVAYALDWRHRVAMAAHVAETDKVAIPVRLAKDHDLRDYAAHIRFRHRHPMSNAETPRPFDRVVQWHGQATARLVAAHLVTPATCQDIASDLGLTAEDVQVYGRLFHDVRDPQDRPIRGVLARLRMDAAGNPANVDALMRTALTAGVTGLRTALGTVVAHNDCDFVDRLVEQELARRVMTGRMQDRDLIRLQANALLRERIAVEAQSGNRDDVEGVRWAMELLGATAPHMVRVQKTAEELSATSLAIEGRIASQRTATGMAPVDVAKSEAALDRMLQTQLGRRAG